MRVLNLTPHFRPYADLGGDIQPLQNTLFPSGCEVRFELPEDFGARLDPDGKVLLTVRIASTDCLMKVVLAADALKRVKEVTGTELFMPYFPYARQDRVMAPGHPLSVRVVAEMVNACGFDRVRIFDPHSDVTPALLNNAEVISNHAFVGQVLQGQENYLVMSPDAGAFKKIQKLCEAIGYTGEVETVSKSRDVKTGHMIVKVPSRDYEGRDVYIIDDIGEGCTSFMIIAQQLRAMNVGRVNLIVSHGILSGKAEENLRGTIDQVYTTDSFPGARFDFVKEYRLCSSILI